MSENMKKHIFQKNGTRYTLYIVPVDKRTSMLCLDYWLTWMWVAPKGVNLHSYIEEKLKVSTRDAKAIEEFLNELFHS